MLAVIAILYVVQLCFIIARLETYELLNPISVALPHQYACMNTAQNCVLSCAQWHASSRTYNPEVAVRQGMGKWNLVCIFCITLASARHRVLKH